MRYEYYCRYCKLPQEVAKPLANMKDTEWCVNCKLPLERQFSIPEIKVKRSAGTIQGEDYAICNEPPDELKPNTYQKPLRDDLEHYKIVSTPTHTRRAGTIERP